MRNQKCLSRTTVSEYLYKVLDFQQIDWEFAVAQMICLCVAPRKVYQFVDYRRQTKNTMARDDPGFVLLLLALITATSLAYCVALRLPLTNLFFVAIIFPAMVYLASGFFVATAIYLLARKQFRLWTNEQRLWYPIQQVEWAYCFDVHSNGVFPVVLICSVFQYFALPFLLQLIPAFFSAVLSNTLYAIAGVYYCYIASLGYSRLSRTLSNAVLLLYPTVGIVLIAVFMTIVGVNMTKVYLSTLTKLFLC